jgi:hypothetical protein
VTSLGPPAKAASIGRVEPGSALVLASGMAA